MATPFLSSEEYDERAHQLYNEGQYDEALTVLHEGLTLYPNSVELHVGVGYAQLAREEFAWARRSFEQALVLEPEHEDGLAGLGESLLKLGCDELQGFLFARPMSADAMLGWAKREAVDTRACVTGVPLSTVIPIWSFTASCHATTKCHAPVDTPLPHATTAPVLGPCTSNVGLGPPT